MRNGVPSPARSTRSSIRAGTKASSTNRPAQNPRDAVRRCGEYRMVDAGHIGAVIDDPRDVASAEPRTYSHARAMDEKHRPAAKADETAMTSGIARRRCCSQRRIDRGHTMFPGLNQAAVATSLMIRRSALTIMPPPMAARKRKAGRKQDAGQAGRREQLGPLHVEGNAFLGKHRCNSRTSYRHERASRGHTLAGEGEGWTLGDAAAAIGAGIAVHSDFMDVSWLVQP